MEFERLFTALVIGGSMLSVGCASKAPPAETTNTNIASSGEEQPQENANIAVDCSKVCDMPNGEQSRDMVCPDPQTGLENCCWLMTELHECCP